MVARQVAPLTILRDDTSDHGAGRALSDGGRDGSPLARRIAARERRVGSFSRDTGRNGDVPARAADLAREHLRAARAQWSSRRDPPSRLLLSRRPPPCVAQGLHANCFGRQNPPRCHVAPWSSFWARSGYLRFHGDAEGVARKVTCWVLEVARVLDVLVVAAHRPRFLNAGTIRICSLTIFRSSSVLESLALSVHGSKTFVFWKFAVAFGAVLVCYQLAYLPLKKSALGQSSRSTLQDLLFCALPVYTIASWALGHPWRSAFDGLALVLPLIMSVVRVGCFVGGCCHGTPCDHGVYYPEHVLRSVRGWREFTPGPFTGSRVLPMQLVEAAYALLIAGVLIWRALRLVEPDGRALPLCLIAYGSFRFVTDFAWSSTSTTGWALGRRNGLHSSRQLRPLWFWQ